MNYATAFSNVPTKTQFTVADMGAPIILLDKIATYNKGVFISCDGWISWNPTTGSGTLTWSDTIHIYFTTAAGDSVENTIAVGTLAAIADKEYVYVTLNETDATVLTAAKAAIPDDTTSTQFPFNRLCLGYRNAADDRFYPVALTPIFAQDSISYAEISAHENATATVLAAQDTDYQVVIFDTNGESNYMTPDHTNDHITVLREGKYLCTASISFSSGTANNYIFHASKNNNAAEFANLHAERTTGVASQIGSASVSGIVDLAVADTIEFWVRRTDGGGVSKSLTVKNITFTLMQISGT